MKVNPPEVPTPGMAGGEELLHGAVTRARVDSLGRPKRVRTQKDQPEPDVGEGLYVVRISEHPDPSINGYDKAVEVTSDAIRESMPSLVVDDGCQLLSELPDATGLEKADLQTSVVKKRTK